MYLYIGYRLIAAYSSMLFCCLRRNVETSCHKHFVVVSRHQQTPPLISSGKCHNLPRSGGTVLITSGRSQGRQHATKPSAGSEYRLLPTPPAFDAPVRGVSSEHAVWYGKTRMVWLAEGEKISKIGLFISTEFTNVTDTDSQTDTE